MKANELQATEERESTELPATDRGGRLQREATFHDEAFAGTPRQAAAKYYATAGAAKRHYHQLLARVGTATDVLEYGCGKGSAAFDLAAAGARVTGIDISQVGIAEAQEQSEALGLQSQLHFEQMNAEDLSFDDDSFDLICGSGILHHLDLTGALAQIRRVLRPGGRAVFFEPLGHNPFINLYRWLTPAMRSADEHPLTETDLEQITAAFDTAACSYFGLFTLLAAPVGPGPTSVLLRALEGLDRLALRHRLLQRHAWIVVTELTLQPEAA